MVLHAASKKALLVGGHAGCTRLVWHSVLGVSAPKENKSSVCVFSVTSAMFSASMQSTLKLGRVWRDRQNIQEDRNCSPNKKPNRSPQKNVTMCQRTHTYALTCGYKGHVPNTSIGLAGGVSIEKCAHTAHTRAESGECVLGMPGAASTSNCSRAVQTLHICQTLPLRRVAGPA